MSHTDHNAVEWLDALLSACREVTPIALGCEVEELARTDGFPARSKSAFVALVGERSSIQMGIAAEQRECQLLAKTLMAIPPDDPDLAEADVADAVGEIVNILGGRVRASMSEEGELVVLGIPVFVHGCVEQTESMEAATCAVRMGQIEPSLFILKSRK